MQKSVFQYGHLVAIFEVQSDQNLRGLGILALFVFSVLARWWPSQE
jgi:hypothetical protein